MEEPLKRKELRHDRHTVSLLTDHLVFSPKYKQDSERGIPAPQGMVRRASLGAELLSWFSGAGVGGGTEIYRNTG